VYGTGPPEPVAALLSVRFGVAILTMVVPGGMFGPEIPAPTVNPTTVPIAITFEPFVVVPVIVGDRFGGTTAGFQSPAGTVV
jgi:hypothetical protein